MLLNVFLTNLQIAMAIKFDNNIETTRKTIFCDIDGTLVKFPDTNLDQIVDERHDMEILPGTIDKLWEWESLGYNIILTTGRKESMREATQKQLRRAGIFWDQLIMGLGPGKRVLINDMVPIVHQHRLGIIEHKENAQVINLKRDEGISEVNV